MKNLTVPKNCQNGRAHAVVLLNMPTGFFFKKKEIEKSHSAEKFPKGDSLVPYSFAIKVKMYNNRRENSSDPRAYSL